MSLRHTSLTVKLPLLMSGLVLVTVVVFAAMLFLSFDDTLYDVSGKQLESAGNLLGDLLAKGIPAVRQRAEHVARDPAIIRFAASGVGKAQALAVIEKKESARDSSRMRSSVISPTATVLVDKTWRPIPAISAWTRSQIVSGRAAGGGAIIGPIQSTAGTATVTTITPIYSVRSGASEHPLAYFVETRALSGSGQDVIGKLIGKKVTFLVGQNNPAEWTDLTRIVPGPPAEMKVNARIRFDTSPRGPGIGYAKAIPGTPWVVWVQQPAASVLAPLTQYVQRLLAYGLGIALFGALIVWLASKRMTRRLVRLTENVEAIEVGTADIGPSVNKMDDEINRLLASFDRMRARLDAHAELESQLRHAQKVDAVGRLAVGVAHDFNNLLTAIRLFGSVSLEDLPTDSPVRSNIEEICKVADRGTLLTKQLLGFTRNSPMQNTVLDVSEVAAGLQKMLQRLLTAHVSLSFAADDSLWPIWADRTHVEQVLMNLAVNARDAMPRGGDLRITMENVTISHATIRGDVHIPRGNYVVTRVADSGEGMRAEIASRIFEPFFTTKPSAKGSGLGLSTVFSIIDHWNGYITVDTALGKGTTFTIFLPRYAPTLSAGGPSAGTDLNQVA